MDLESVFLNGTVGAGKTTTGEALHWLLAADGISNAVIDLDELRRSWPGTWIAAWSSMKSSATSVSTPMW